MSNSRVHAFAEDAMGQLDAVGLAARIRSGEVSRKEVLEAAIARARRVEGAINAIAWDAFDKPIEGMSNGEPKPFDGVPTFIKDNVDVAGLRTQHGSRAIEPRVAAKHSEATEQLRAQGLVVLGKSRLPEFGFSCTTEYERSAPTRNPWNLEYSSGASSGGAAALVAAGVVPIAHGNDGAGSLRIPSGCCGLVSLKVTRGRLIEGDAARKLPVKIVTEGVITRSVRDQAHFLAAAEDFHHHRRLQRVGLVEGPGTRKLRVAMVFDSIGDNRSDDETRAMVARVGHTLEKLGHRVEVYVPPVPEYFVEDFKIYWGMMALSISRLGKVLFKGFTRAEDLDNLTRGLERYLLPRLARLPLAIARLQHSSRLYARAMQQFDVALSPIVSHTTPKLGYLSPTVPFEQLFARILKWIAFTPLNNAAGSPAIALPAGLSRDGLPMGVQLQAAHGAERLLLELAYELESELPKSRIQDIPQDGRRVPSTGV